MVFIMLGAVVQVYACGQFAAYGPRNMNYVCVWNLI